MRGVPEDRGPLGPPADVHDLRQDRLLRLVAESPCETACEGGRRPDRPVGGAGRRLELVLHRRGGVRRRMSEPTLPALPLAEWEPTKNTLHLWTQIVGKVRMASSPPRNHWWHVPLYVDVRGLTTRRLHSPNGLTFQIDFDFVAHRLVVKTAGGVREVVRSGGGVEESFRLVDGLSVSMFDSQLHGLLGRLGIDVAIRESPFGVPMTTPFPTDVEHASYDADAVGRFWRILDWSDWVLEEFSGWYCDKTSPVHLFWHSLDLAVTRFSSRRAPPLPDADPVTQEAYSHELVSFGFWAGDQSVREPSYYSYTSPEPPGLRGTHLQPDEGRWIALGAGSMALLPYEVVR